jgi:hypothetical protein
MVAANAGVPAKPIRRGRASRFASERAPSSM